MSKIKLEPGPYGDPSSLGALAQPLVSEAILKTARCLIIILDAEGHILGFNAECERLTGYLFAEVQGRKFFEFLIPEAEQVGVQEEFKRLHEGLFPSTYENDWLTRDGKHRLIRWANNVILGDQGQILYIVSCGIDVTDKHRIERDLAEAKDRYEAALKGSKDGIWDWDLRTNVSRMSDRAWEMLGFKPGDLPAEADPFFSRVHPEDLSRLKQLVQTYLSAPSGSFEAEVRVMHREGRQMWFSVRGAAVCDETGTPYQLAGSHRDITDRKGQEKILLEQQRVLAQSEIFFRNVIDANPNLIVVRDKSGRHVLANLAAANRYGTTPEKIIGRKVTDLVSDRDETKLSFESDLRIIDGIEDEIKLQVVTQTPEGPRHYRTTKRPIFSPATGERQVLSVSVDVTNWVDQQRDLERARKEAEESLRLKSEFLANISHEIRTPMNGVIGITELLIDSNLRPDQVDLAQTILQSANSLLAVLNDILDFSKIEAGKLRVDEVPINLADLVEEVCIPFYIRARAKGLSFSCEVDWSEDWLIVSDPGRLRQIFINLLGNAVKFTDVGGIKVALARSDQGVSVSVSDTGIGMTDEDLQSVFDAFVQADGSMTRKHGGTGLGLAISKELSHMLGGDIRVESTYQKGSRFTFLLGPTSITPPEEQPTPLDGLTIAVNLRDLEVANVAKKALTSLGAEIVDLGEDPEIRITHEVNRDGLARVEVTRRDGRSAAITQAGLLTRRALLESVLEAPTAEVTGPKRFKGTVLLVEDNSVNQMVATRVLASHGLKIDLAVNGLEAVEKAASTNYDLIFMDLQMPEMDGFEATRRIRTMGSQAGIHVPIVAMTAHALQRDEEKCLEVGMDAYIPKPLNRRELCKQLERWLPKEVDPLAWFDLDYVQTCFGEDQAFFREVLETFVISSRELVSTVELAWNEGNAMLLAESIHTLKGSSRSIGATQYAQFCQDCEAAKGSDRHAAAVRQVIDRAEELFLACQQIIAAP